MRATSARLLPAPACLGCQAAAPPPRSSPPLSPHPPLCPCPALPQWEALWKNLQKWGRGLARAGLDFGGETQMAELQDISEHACLPACRPACLVALPACPQALPAHMSCPCSVFLALCRSPGTCLLITWLLGGFCLRLVAAFELCPTPASAKCLAMSAVETYASGAPKPKKQRKAPVEEEEEAAPAAAAAVAAPAAEDEAGDEDEEAKEDDDE